MFCNVIPYIIEIITEWCALCSLSSVVCGGGTVGVRHLYADRAALELTKKLRTYLPTVVGRPYEIDIGEVLKSGMGRRSGVVTSDGMFCSQLVAGMMCVYVGAGEEG